MRYRPLAVDGVENADGWLQFLPAGNATGHGLISGESVLCRHCSEQPPVSFVVFPDPSPPAVGCYPLVCNGRDGNGYQSSPLRMLSIRMVSIPLEWIPMGWLPWNRCSRRWGHESDLAFPGVNRRLDRGRHRLSSPVRAVKRVRSARLRTSVRRAIMRVIARPK